MSTEDSNRPSLRGRAYGSSLQVKEFGTPRPPPPGQEELPALLQNEVVTITPAVLHPGDPTPTHLQLSWQFMVGETSCSVTQI